MSRKIFDRAGLTAILVAVAVSTPILNSSDAQAQTARSAQVVVVNNTGKRIANLTLLHKYSDKWDEEFKFPKLLMPGQSTKLSTVRYETGFLRTGTDWWALNWAYANGEPKLYYTDPNNFRGFVDFLESSARFVIPAVATGAAALAGAVCTAESAGACGPAAGAAIKATAAASTALSAKMFGEGSTEGFKQYTLREDDHNQKITITLNANGTVDFEAPSGDSSTVYNSMEVEMPSDLSDTIREYYKERVAVNKGTHLLEIDCDAGVDHGGTKNTVTATFVDQSGRKIGHGTAQPSSSKGSYCLSYELPVTLVRGAQPENFYLEIDGDDASMVDKVTMYSPSGAEINSWGGDNTSGWCLSTDANDANGIWKDNVYQNECKSEWEFKF
ncbi:MAG: hypothetical protein AAGF54_05100 [Pseudomonadota bacterium]